MDRGRIEGVLWRRDAARCGGLGLLAKAGEVARAARRFGDATGTPETRYSLTELSRPAGCDWDVGEGVRLNVAVKARTGRWEVIRVRSSIPS